MFIPVTEKNRESNSLLRACVSFNPPIRNREVKPFWGVPKAHPKTPAYQLGRAGRTGLALTLTFVPTLAQKGFQSVEGQLAYKASQPVLSLPQFPPTKPYLLHLAEYGCPLF